MTHFCKLLEWVVVEHNSVAIAVRQFSAKQQVSLVRSGLCLKTDMALHAHRKLDRDNCSSRR